MLMPDPPRNTSGTQLPHTQYIGAAEQAQAITLLTSSSIRQQLKSPNKRISDEGGARAGAIRRNW